MLRIYKRDEPTTGNENCFTFYTVVHADKSWQVWRKTQAIGKPDVMEFISAYDYPGPAYALADWYNDAGVKKAAQE